MSRAMVAKLPRGKSWEILFMEGGEEAGAQTGRLRHYLYRGFRVLIP